MAQKSWAALMRDVGETMRKWKITGWTLDAQLIGAKATRQQQSSYERRVTLKFRRWHLGDGYRPVELTLDQRSRSIDNLHALCQIIEFLRMIDYYKGEPVARMFYQQLYPQATPATPPPPRAAAPTIPGHYSVLGVLPSAPFEVVKAAYQAQARLNHPDSGGSTARMQRINAAMQQVRKERT